MNESKNVSQSGETFTPELEVSTVREGQPHVVILGSGASRATCLNGDKNKRILPTFENLIDVVGLQAILDAHGIQRKQYEDFERLYSRLHKDGGFADCLSALEECVHDYFSKMELPDQPTIYDHLVLSLHPRDVIATFNWDPLLVQAAMRNASHVELPMLLFLHGNVAVGYCEKDKRKGPYPGRCPVCRNSLQPTRLLYPVEKKNYQERTFIWDEWQDLRDRLKDACIMTIFGYGAPATDVEAVDLMQTAWPDPKKQMAQWIEIINIESEAKLRSQWKQFVLLGHDDIYSDFYQSRIARHPRRTGEAWAATHLFAMWEDGNPWPRNAAFPELRAWFDKLTDAEKGCGTPK